MDRAEQGRSRLRRWEAGKPTNFYEDDDVLRAALALHLGADALALAAPVLRQAGADSAGPVSRACALVDRPEHLPRLETWNGVGDRTEEILFHPAYDDIGRRVWASGVLAVLGEPGNQTLHAALAYLFALNGEGAHLCAVACTAGLVKAIQRCGEEWMRREWLPRLLERDYDRRWHGAQFLTEVQGGSDVGANACRARAVGGAGADWRISGEKWFCSNVSADLYAVSARPEGAPDGTSGVALFVVPRRLPDGRPNGVRIRRLKSKLGTRTLPTAEVDFEDAVAYPLGPLDEGFKLMMDVIINTSRLEVAIGSCGMMRRAWVEAVHYAGAREAFGQRLIEFPAVRQQLAEMRALAAAGLGSTLFVAALEDRLTVAGAHPEDDSLFRTAVNVNKYICSHDAGLVVHHAIEIFGGNGTIEDFSVLPRLYREVPVQESWEGPHNTLMAQLLRDARRAKMHDALLAAAQDLLVGVDAPDLAGPRDLALAVLGAAEARMAALLRDDAAVAALHIRALVSRIARVFQVAALLTLAEASPAGAPRRRLAAMARLVCNRWLLDGYDPLADPGYPALLAAIVD